MSSKVTLRIEHPVPSFAVWKRAFEGDPLNRKANGVRRHRVLRPADDAKFVTVDLDFESMGEAEAFRTALQGLWRNVEGSVMTGPRAQILELVEHSEY